MTSIISSMEARGCRLGRKFKIPRDFGDFLKYRYSKIQFWYKTDHRNPIQEFLGIFSCSGILENLCRGFRGRRFFESTTPVVIISSRVAIIASQLGGQPFHTTILFVQLVPFYVPRGRTKCSQLKVAKCDLVLLHVHKNF